MRIPALVALGAAAYAVFLVATMPASYGVARMRSAPLQWHSADGTIWNGSARATLRLPQAQVRLDRLEWRFRPSRLLAGRVAFDVDAASGTLAAQGRIERGISVTELRDLQARGDAAWAATIAPWLTTWQPQGALEVKAFAIAWDGAELRGDATAELHRASVLLSEVRPLGSYRAQLKGADGPARITLTTIEGPLRLAGEGTLGADGRMTFSGEARGEGASAAALEPLLNLIGPRRPDGARELRWRAP